MNLLHATTPRKVELNGVIERINRRTSPSIVWYFLIPVGQELRMALTNIVDVAQRLNGRQLCP